MRCSPDLRGGLMTGARRAQMMSNVRYLSDYAPDNRVCARPDLPPRYPLGMTRTTSAAEPRISPDEAITDVIPEVRERLQARLEILEREAVTIRRALSVLAEEDARDLETVTPVVRVSRPPART